MNTTWHRAPIAAATSRPDAARHPDVEERDLRAGARRTARAPASPSSASATTASVRPHLAQLVFQPLAHERLVFGNERGGTRVDHRRDLAWQRDCGSARALRGRAAGSTMRARNPRGAFSSSDERRALAVQELEPLADVGEADAACGQSDPRARRRCRRRRDRRRRRRRARRRTSMRPPRGLGSMPCLIAFSVSVITMPGGIGQSATSSATSHGPREPRAEPRLHDAEVGADHRRLLANRRHLVAQRRRRGAQEADELADEARRLRRALLRELLRAAQRVEQEVRLDLQLQELELRLGELARRLALPRLGLEVRGHRAVLAVAQVRDQRGDEREQDAEHESRGDDVAELGAVLEEHEGVHALDEPRDARADAARRRARGSAPPRCSGRCGPGSGGSRTTRTVPTRSASARRG